MSEGKRQSAEYNDEKRKFGRIAILSNIDVRENYDREIFKDRMTSYRFTDRAAVVPIPGGTPAMGEMHGRTPAAPGATTTPKGTPGFVFPAEIAALYAIYIYIMEKEKMSDYLLYF